MKEFNSFQVILKETRNKEPLNPYLITLKQGFKNFKNKLQLRKQYMGEGDESIIFKCENNKCEPPIPFNINEDILLNDITDKSKNILNKDIIISSNKKSTFNPLLYICDIHKLKIIQDSVLSIPRSSDNYMKLLLHEVIKNGYINDLITYQYLYNKEEIHYNENKPNELILNEKILTILNELKILYYDDIHKYMGYPLQLFDICAILLYCGKSCNVEFSYDQIQYRHFKWVYLDDCLGNAIRILHKYERREEENIELYCGLKKVRLQNEKEIKAGYFISHVSTSDDLQVAKMFRSDQGCILHFHPSMRRAGGILSCDVSWISPYKHEREILFSRSNTSNIEDRHKEYFAWNAKIEKEDKNTQMILLTWGRYDQYIQQTMYISKIWNHFIDLNLIYIILLFAEGDIILKNNKRKYEEIKNEFIKRRCYNDYINLFSIFAVKIKNIRYTPIEFTTKHTIMIGLPFVEKDKEK
ncbi:hypothetical protein RFI_32237 [Reticulomyxa filosa]|uniref:Uncharacterized protein n=1 Tax=Reticulomyxa filosa TaxID=46433 RepID=X6LUT6_RETFI|nr:hypothetical protein RFI_32237 [Reticulomyxa filosa]|eukprot:ETO05156.1 hypothetical protein RFI_32237 [Reticulomyxa filosa]